MTEPIRVLYVDDEAHSLALRKELLERQGSFEVTTCTSAAAGLEHLKRTEFDCLVSDFNMPETDGIEFLNVVREEHPDLPFIIFSGEDSEEAVQTAIDEGATDYLPKSTASISYQLFAHRIRQAVAGAGTEASTAAADEVAVEDTDVDIPDDDLDAVTGDTPARDDGTPVDDTDDAIAAGFAWLFEGDQDAALDDAIAAGFTWLFEGDQDAALDDAIAAGFAWLIGEDEAEAEDWDGLLDDEAVAAGFAWIDSLYAEPAAAFACPVAGCSFTAHTAEAVTVHGIRTSLADDTEGLHHRLKDWSAGTVTADASDPEPVREPVAVADTTTAPDAVDTPAMDTLGTRPSEPAADSTDGRVVTATTEHRSTRHAVEVLLEAPASADRGDIEALSRLDRYALARRLEIPGRGDLDETELIDRIEAELSDSGTSSTASVDADETKQRSVNEATTTKTERTTAAMAGQATDEPSARGDDEGTTGQSAAVAAVADPSEAADSDTDVVSPTADAGTTDTADPVAATTADEPATGSATDSVETAAVTEQTDLESLSTLDLYDLARRLELPGRGRLSDAELVEAIDAALADDEAESVASQAVSVSAESAARRRGDTDRSDRRRRSRHDRRRRSRVDRPPEDASPDDPAEEPADGVASATDTPAQQSRRPDDLLAELLDLLADRLRGGPRTATQPAPEPAAEPAQEAETPPDADEESPDGEEPSTDETADSVDADDADEAPTESALDPLIERDDEADAADAPDEADDEPLIGRRTGVIHDPSDIEIDSGESALVLCDSHSKNREPICHHLLEGPTEMNTLLIRFTQLDADDLETLAADANELHIVSVGYDQRVPPALRDDVETSKVNNATDLTRLGIITTSIVDAWEDEPGEIRVCFDSINVLLRYGNIQRIFQFLHLLLGKLEAADSVTHFHLDPDSEEAQDVGIFKTLMDIIVEDTGAELVVEEG